MQKRFIVVSGIPGSGKTTLARRLAPALHLPLLDKDDFLERLFEEKGVGDAAWRRALSRESDAIFQREAIASGGAILTSFWHQPGMAADSGTPTDWLAALDGRVVNVECRCDPETAAQRFFQRKRHPGHLDVRPYAEVLASIKNVAALPPLEIGQRVVVDTSTEADLDSVIRVIRG